MSDVISRSLSQPSLPTRSTISKLIHPPMDTWVVHPQPTPEPQPIHLIKMRGTGKTL